LAYPIDYAGGFGYQQDSDSGLMLLGHRYYDPSTGRFLTRDPIKDGRNWYSYGGGNGAPTGFVDPDGLRRWLIHFLDFWASLPGMVPGIFYPGLLDPIDPGTIAPDRDKPSHQQPVPPARDLPKLPDDKPRLEPPSGGGKPTGPGKRPPKFPWIPAPPLPIKPGGKPFPTKPTLIVLAMEAVFGHIGVETGKKAKKVRQGFQYLRIDRHLD
jgi:RHS repeat-associated protein